MKFLSDWNEVPNKVQGCYTAAAIATSVAVAVATVATQAVAASKAGKGAKQTTSNQPPPQQTALQQIVSRLLLGRYQQGPQTFGQYRSEGPRPYPQTNYSPFEAMSLGMLPEGHEGSIKLPSGQTLYPQSLTPGYLEMINASFTPEAMLANAQNPQGSPPWAIHPSGRQWFMGPQPQSRVSTGGVPPPNPQQTQELFAWLTGANQQPQLTPVGPGQPFGFLKGGMK
jgi:hypothetical protein